MSDLSDKIFNFLTTSPLKKITAFSVVYQAMEENPYIEQDILRNIVNDAVSLAKYKHSRDVRAQERLQAVSLQVKQIFGSVRALANRDILLLDSTPRSEDNKPGHPMPASTGFNSKDPEIGKEAVAEVQACLSKLPVSTVDVSSLPQQTDKQNSVNTKVIDNKVIENKEIDDFYPEEPVNPDHKENDVVPEVPASPRTSEEKKMDFFLDEVNKKRVGDEIRQCNREKKLQDNSRSPLNEKNEQEQGLRHELFAYIEGKGSATQSRDKAFDIEIPEFSLEAILKGSSEVTAQNVADLFRVAMKAYEDRIRDVKSTSIIDDQSARTMVYNEIKTLLPDITDVNLRQKMFRAKKIYVLFMGIGIDKIQVVSYSASAISSLNENQIHDIIKCFPQKADNTDESIGVTNCNAHVTEQTDSSKLSDTK
ncbi:19772_t:CDS:2, partial [Racocetra fulgida]